VYFLYRVTPYLLGSATPAVFTTNSTSEAISLERYNCLRQCHIL